MRLFAAIGIPGDIGARLAALQTGGPPGATWTDPDSFHVTLRFIGETGFAEAEEIAAALAALSAPGFEIQLAGVDAFRTGLRPRLLWVGLAPNPALIDLARKIDRALPERDAPPTKERKITPHVTIARLKDAPMPAVMRFICDNALFRAPGFAVDHFTLYESRQGAGGPVYVPLADYPLGGAA